MRYNLLINAILPVLFFTSFSSWGGIFSIHDPQILLASGTGYYIYSNGQKIKLEKTHFVEYINKLNNEILEKSLEAADTLEDSKEEARGRMIPKDLKRVYTGEYANAQAYAGDTFETKLLTDNTYRLQKSGIDAIIDTMKNHPEIVTNKNISVRIHQVENVTATSGASTGIKVTISTDIISGDINELEAKLKNIVEMQNPSSVKGSIIKIDLAWEVKSSPNPELASQLKARVNSLTVETNELKRTKEEKVNSKRISVENTIKRLKKINTTSVGVILGLMAISVVREATAEELIAIDQACLDPAFLEIKATGAALAGDPKFESTADYMLKIEEACAEL